jgi:CheY-like chemotaxis protein
METYQIKNLKILIVEDECNSDLVLTIALRKYAGEILHAKTGKEAVEICRMNSDIDLVLMDIVMPELSGYDATSQIRMFDKKVMIIAQTAMVSDEDRKIAISAGCNDYMTKPINIELLISLIKRNLDFTH